MWQHQTERKPEEGRKYISEMYLEVGQRDGLHEVKAECNSKKVL